MRVDRVQRLVGSIARCESPTFAGVCTSEAPLARTYRQLGLDERRTLFRLLDACTPVGEIADRLGRHPSTIYRELGRNRFRDGDRGFCGYFPPERPGPGAPTPATPSEAGHERRPAGARGRPGQGWLVAAADRRPAEARAGGRRDGGLP